MTIQELEEQVKVLQEEIEDMKEKEQKSSKWKPKKMDIYWFLDNCGDIIKSCWNNHSIDIWRYNNIPIFQTEEECEQYKKFREDVSAHSYEFSDEEWNDSLISKWYIAINYYGNTLHYGHSYTDRFFGQLCFKTKADAQYVIETYPEELRKWRI